MRKRKQKEGIKRRRNSKYWWASFTDASGRRVEKSTQTTSKTEALKVRAKWITDEWNKQIRGVHADATFPQVALYFLRGTKSVKRSSGTDEQRFKPLVSYFDDELNMNTLSSDDVRGYIQSRLLEDIANKTINKELSVLSTAIKWCNSQFDWALPNPCVGKRLPEEEVEARCLSATEVKLLLKAARDTTLPDNQNKHTKIYLPEFIILGFTTMMRPSEMLELEWDRVDFSSKTVELRVEDTKGKQRRLVPLNDDAVGALLRLRRVCDENFPDARWVFTHTKPRYFGKRIKSVSKVFQLAVERAGIDHATPHSLRHTSITEGVHVDGANVVDIAKVAGHKNLKTTMGYVHTADARLQEVVSGLPKIETL